MKVLFITSTRIGDGVLSTGLVDWLHRHWPDARVTVAAGEQSAPLFEAAPNVERIIVVVKQKHSFHWWRLWRDTAFTFWDLVVDLRRSAIAYLLFANRRCVLERSDEPVHRVRQLADLFDLAEPPSPRIWTTPGHDVRAAGLVPDGAPVIGIGPVTNWRAKNWRVERFVDLVGRLTSSAGRFPDARIAVFSGPDERDAARPVLDAIADDRLIDLAGTVDLLTASACLKRCALYVGNDSAVMHLAAAAGIPTIGLFGPSDDRHYAPWGYDTLVVRTPEGFPEIFPPGFDHRTSDTLMDGLTVDAVEAAIADLWQGLGREAA